MSHRRDVAKFELLRELSESSETGSVNESSKGEDAVAKMHQIKRRLDAKSSEDVLDQGFQVGDVQDIARSAAREGIISDAHLRDFDAVADDLLKAGRKWSNAVDRLYAVMRKGSSSKSKTTHRISKPMKEGRSGELASLSALEEGVTRKTKTATSAFGEADEMDALTKKQIETQLDALEGLLKKVRDENQRKELLKLVKQLSLALARIRR